MALLLLPSGSQPAKVAGIWAMIAMAGANLSMGLVAFNKISNFSVEGLPETADVE